MNPDDEILLAYVDGELGEADRLRIEAAIAADPALAERVRRHRALRRRIGETFAPVAEEPVPERLRRAVRGGRGAEVVELAAARPRRRAPAAGPWAAMAACAVIGLAAGLGLVGLRSQPLVASGPQGLEARGVLAKALDRQLAASGQPGSVRIGLSFLSTGGRYCRSFTAPAQDLAGLACKDARGWRVQLAVAAAREPRTEYRTAASETPSQVLDAVQSMISGAPLDARQEAAARARGWRR